MKLPRQTLMNPKINRQKIIIDADKKSLGALSVCIANELRGKNSTQYVSNQDIGNFVQVTNYNKVFFSGNKLQDKKYYSHSGYIGHLKTKTLQNLKDNDPKEIIRKAVLGMLPKNTLRKNWIKRLEFKEISQERVENE